MRWKEPLDEILGSRAKVRILRCLWRVDGEALSGREIARRTGMSHTAVLAALDELETEDVVWPSSDPTGIRYRLNRTNVVTRAGLMPMFELEGSLEDRLKRFVLDAVPEAVSVVLFGSVARGDDGAVSDVDVLVVVPDELDTFDVGDRIHGVECYAKLGKMLMPIIWTVGDLARAIEERMPLVSNLMEDGKLLAGEPLLSVASSWRADAFR